LAKNCLGATVLAAPDSLQFAGGVEAYVSIMVFNIAVHTCTYAMMAVGCAQSGAKTYREWWLAVNGRRGIVLLDLLLFVNGFSTLIAYVILVGDFATKSFEGLLPGATALHSRAVDVVVFTLLALLPLSLLRDLSLLAWASRFGLLCVFYSAAFCFGEYITTAPSGSSPSGHAHRSFAEALGPEAFAGLAAAASPVSAFGILVAGTGSQVLTPKFFAELKQGTPRLYTMAAFAGEVVAHFFYLVFGLVGFARFGPSPPREDGNLLVNYRAASAFEQLTWLSMAVNMCVMYPLQLAPVRESAIGLFHALGFRSDSKRGPRSRELEMDEEEQPQGKEESNEFTTCTMVLVALSVALGLQGMRLSVINLVKGTIIMPLTCFVIPACLYRRGAAASSQGVAAGVKKSEGAPGWMSTYSLICLVFGIIMLAKGVAQFASARHLPDAFARVSFVQLVFSSGSSPSSSASSVFASVAAPASGGATMLRPPRFYHRGGSSAAVLGPS
jgi:amino acid permease